MIGSEPVRRVSPLEIVHEDLPEGEQISRSRTPAARCDRLDPVEDVGRRANGGHPDDEGLLARVRAFGSEEVEPPAGRAFDLQLPLERVRALGRGEHRVGVYREIGKSGNSIPRGDSMRRKASREVLMGGNGNSRERSVAEDRRDRQGGDDPDGPTLEERAKAALARIDRYREALRLSGDRRARWHSANAHLAAAAADFAVLAADSDRDALMVQGAIGDALLSECADDALHSVTGAQKAIGRLDIGLEWRTRGEALASGDLQGEEGQELLLVIAEQLEAKYGIR